MSHRVSLRKRYFPTSPPETSAVAPVCQRETGETEGGGGRTKSGSGHYFLLMCPVTILVFSLLIIFIISSSSCMKQNEHFVSFFSNYYPFIIY